jgi:hypothetical protein
MAFCSHCGDELVAGAQVCHHCGTAVSPTTAAATDTIQSAIPPAREPRGGRHGVIIGAVVALVVVLGGVGTYLATSRRSHRDGLASCLVGQWQLTKEEDLIGGQWRLAPTSNDDAALQMSITFAVGGTTTVSLQGQTQHGSYTLSGDNLTTYIRHPNGVSTTATTTATCSDDTLVVTEHSEPSGYQAGPATPQSDGPNPTDIGIRTTFTRVG